jgi:hypothetical protein
MANVKIIFCGSSHTPKHEIKTETYSNELFVSINMGTSEEFFISLDKQTAIKFSKEIRKQISYLESEV